MPAIARRVVSLALVAVAKLAHRSISPDLLAVRTFLPRASGVWYVWEAVRIKTNTIAAVSEARRVHTPRCREQGACIHTVV